MKNCNMFFHIVHDNITLLMLLCAHVRFCIFTAELKVVGGKRSGKPNIFFSIFFCVSLMEVTEHNLGRG